MTKFVDIYQDIVKRKTLRDEISSQTVVLPKCVARELQEQEWHKELVISLREKDKLRAKDRLEKIQAQLKNRTVN